MSGFEIVGVVLGLYPVVINAVAVYKATKSGRAATSLHRKLKTEEQIFRQFVEKLGLAPPIPDCWKSEELNQKLRLRLGASTAELILETLGEIDGLFKELNVKLQSIDRGVDVLGRFRAGLKVARYSAPQSSFQYRLSNLTTLNSNLNRLLNETGDAPLRIVRSRLKIPQFLVRNYQEVIDLYDWVCREGYDCECDNPHVTSFGLHCPTYTALDTVRLQRSSLGFGIGAAPSKLIVDAGVRD